MRSLHSPHLCLTVQAAYRCSLRLTLSLVLPGPFSCFPYVFLTADSQRDLSVPSQLASVLSVGSAPAGWSAMWWCRDVCAGKHSHCRTTSHRGLDTEFTARSANDWSRWVSKLLTAAVSGTTKSYQPSWPVGRAARELSRVQPCPWVPAAGCPCAMGFISSLLC